MNINEIKDAVRARGSHWFDPDTMRTFGTRVHETVYEGENGIFFVTSDKSFDGSRGYTVRQFEPKGASIETVGDGLCGYSTRGSAHAAAKKLAGKQVTETSVAFVPVGEMEQFLHDLRQHGCRLTDAEARQLIKLAKKHHRLQEDACNGEVPEDYDAEVKDAITRLAKKIGCRGVRFSGDPRGCTVKLIFHDGATNDWASEGWAVPQR